MTGMVSPVKGRVSSGYGPRDYAPSPFHAGLDIAAPVGTPVHAPYAGVVKKEGSNVAPYRSGDRNVLIANPDGEGQYFGHLSKNFVRVGQHVAQGEIIGEVGARGNVTGPHLHFEVWSNWRDPSSHRDPMIDFNHFGVKPGSKPKVTAKPKPKPKPKPDAGGAAERALTRSVRSALKAMGLPQTVGGVKAYQRQHGLYEDGVWGSVTRAYYHWVKRLQVYLNKWKNVQRHYPNGIRIDGYRGPITRKAEGYARAGATRAVPYDPPNEPPKRG